MATLIHKVEKNEKGKEKKKKNKAGGKKNGK